MGRRLFLLRHAKSNWKDPSLDDFDRPLNKRGREAAPAMGQMMTDQGWEPGLILCSAAKRTQQTLDRILAKLESTPELDVSEGLYLASASHILKQVQASPDTHNSLMVIGHNPGIEILANDLSAYGDVDVLNRLYQKYPTAALSVIDFDVDKWRKIGAHKGKLEAFIRPRHIEEDRPK